ncbi:AAA family ATPase [Pelagibius sp. Alg239-R121]|uniref:AAA family ATPase n=1 Tax=Pelagibius sp. Alg239-R121 TaxID=2993448 RepID=UPI0024A70CC9|nr:AAA family ATPase [Pelagibius sp. Alg239-R121]
MHIERIQIEEGFLDGLDVCPTPGLNVIIGARGTGKTSLIELIRFCLDVPGYTQKSSRRSREHALSVLGSGQITLTLVDGARRVKVTRSAAEDAPRASGPFLPPIVLSQTEIETVGLQPGGRLQLLDGFLGDQRSLNAAETEAMAAVQSLTAEADAVRLDIEQLNLQLAELPALEEQLQQLAPQEQHLATLSSEAQARTVELNSLSGTISMKGVAVAATERFQDGIASWCASLIAAQGSMPPYEPWPHGGDSDPLDVLRPRAAAAYNHLAHAISELVAVKSEAGQLLLQLNGDKISFEDQARQLRGQIENLQVGAGEIIRRGQVLRERKAQLESLGAVRHTRNLTLENAIQRRTAALDQLELIRTQRFQMRTAVATDLNKVLGPRIRIDVLRSGQTEGFAAAIAEALRGSGLKYNELVTTLAQRMSPRELLESIETNNFQLVANCGGMSPDRAAKVIIALKEADLGAIATVAIEDYVRFSLLDGADHKDIADLSTGQRCTVVLPLVLRHTDRLLIVDQPEDHIDNGFIVDTLIRSILARAADGQILFSTHNANIPVLGSADFVLQLGSDGKRGFQLVAAPLSDPAVVNAITMIMEGGLQAFDSRAEFYGAQR